MANSLLGFLASSNSTLQLAGAAVSVTAASLALVKPQDENIPAGIMGFLFSIPLQETLTLQSQITDHWTQSNTAIQDHIAIQPIKVTLTGSVSDLVWEKSQVAAFAEQTINRIANTPGLEPGFAQASIDALYVYNESVRLIAEAKKVINDTATLFGVKSTAITNQQKAFSQLTGFFNARTLCTISTPWGPLQNMAIENLQFTQEETTKDVSEISVTFKQLNFISITPSVVQLARKPQAQKAKAVDQGTAKGQSILSTIRSATIKAFAN